MRLLSNNKNDVILLIANHSCLTGGGNFIFYQKTKILPIFHDVFKLFRKSYHVTDITSSSSFEKTVKILLITPIPTHPCNSGNRARVHSLAKQLKNAPVELHIAFVSQHAGDQKSMEDFWGKDFCHWVDYAKSTKYSNFRKWFEHQARSFARFVCRALSFLQIDVPHTIDEWCGDVVVDQCSSIIQKINPDVVWIEYAYLSRIFDVVPHHCYKILDTHDVCANRHKMIRSQGRKPTFFYTTPEQEKIGCQRADLVLAIQDHEKNYFSKQYNTTTLTLGHFHEAIDAPPPHTELPIIAFVGSNNIINLDGLEWFMKCCWQDIIAAIPDAQLEVYGRICRAIHVRRQKNVRLLGNVDDLDSAYQRSAIVIAPLKMGTGIKIKCIEALARGKAMVATSCAAEGIEEFSGYSYLLADEATDYSKSCMRLLKDHELRSKMAINALEVSRKLNARQQGQIQKILTMAEQGIIDRSSPQSS